MDGDISPKLLSMIKEVFNKTIDSNKEAKTIMNKITNGKGNFQDLNSITEIIGDSLAYAFKKVLSVDNLPDGTLYWNIANSVIPPMLKQNHELIMTVSQGIQKNTDKLQGLRLNPVKTEINTDKIQGIIKNVCDDGIELNDSISRLQENTVNFTFSSMDGFIHKNASLRDKAGFKTIVIRTSEQGCCDWCSNLEGEYDYDEIKDSGNDVWKRHENCRCTIEYRTIK